VNKLLERGRHSGFASSFCKLQLGFAGRMLPDCRKGLTALQERFRPDKCKQSLENITFQNKEIGHPDRFALLIVRTYSKNKLLL
jgi:hypothetical protein